MRKTYVIKSKKHISSMMTARWWLLCCVLRGRSGEPISASKVVVVMLCVARAEREPISARERVARAEWKPISRRHQ